MILEEVQNNLFKKLISAGIEESEAKKEISILIEEFKDDLKKINCIVEERIKTRTPIQYLIGKAYFMDFTVKVNRSVLIPRPETEILVEETIKRCSGTPRRALDIGTGTGIIPIAIARKIPNIKFVAIDIEKEIIDLAKENAKLNDVENRIDFKKCDIFSDEIEKIFQNNKFDLIISNPPYVVVGNGRDRSLQPEIVHEPKIALFGSKENKTGLIYYERIIELVYREWSRPFPIKLIAFEINPSLVNDLKKMLKKNNLNNFETVKDYAKLDRCLFVRLINS